MYYSINVSRRINSHQLSYQHFFATAEHSITDENKARIVYAELLKKFPEVEGYKVEVTKWEKIGKTVIFN